MNAMVWWDHQTDSVWSQPWGAAIGGPLKGTGLKLLPASIVPWGTWLAEQPETTLVTNDLQARSRGGTPRDNFVIGVSLGDSGTGYRYESAAERRVTNDRIGGNPIVVFADPDDRNIKVYLRRIDTSGLGGSAPSELTFEAGDSGRIVDVESGSQWDMVRGVAVGGPFKGVRLQPVPYVTFFDWAWLDFFPQATIFGE